MNQFIFALFILFSCCFSGFSQQSKNNLSFNWQFRQIGQETWNLASVPGSVHMDLLQNKLIEDPFFRDNEKSLQWIEKEDWEYKTDFFADDKFLKNDHIELKFEGLDTYASIYINDNPVLRTDNMFRTWSIDCKKLLKKGKNTIHIQFFSTARIALSKIKNLPYTLPGDEKPFVRKAAFQFGWDFSPRFVTSGIWKPVYLECWNNIKIQDVQIIQNSVTKSSAGITAACEIFADKAIKADINLIEKYSGKSYQKKQVLLKKGNNLVNINFPIDSPKLWWCNGLGESFLYTTEITLSLQKKIIDSKNVTFGIRTIEVVQDKDSTGRSFYFKLNGTPVYMKGANYVPQEIFLSRVDTAKYENLITDAKRCNMNMIRIWGGGIYEQNKFYELCDKNGILVWQDFMFACSMYPGDSLFLSNVKQEAIENVKRLRNHPCIAMWCGNNEVDEGWRNWGWQKQYKYSVEDSVKIWTDYEKLFLQILPSVVAQEDKQRFYWPSSPKIGWGHAESMKEGDSHYWGVWWGNEPFTNYTKKIGRFVSEFGFQGMPDFRTIAEFTNPEDRNLNSKILDSHQKHATGFSIIKSYLEQDYIAPDNFEKYIYVSQLVQAYGIKTAIEAQRKAKPYCMGSLYWQLNDCWPGITWSGRDFNGRWKALQYFIEDAFKEFLITISEENEELKIGIVSDKQTKQAASISIKLMTMSGKIKYEKNQIIEIQQNAHTQLFKIPMADYVTKRNREEMVFYAELKIAGNIVAKNFFYFAPAKNLKLEKPIINTEINTDSAGITIFLRTDKPAKNVHLTTESACIFSTNFFDIIPGQVLKTNCYTLLNAADLEKQLKIMTLFDVNK